MIFFLTGFNLAKIWPCLSKINDINKRIPEFIKSKIIIIDAIPGPKLCQKINFNTTVIGINKILKNVNITAILAAKLGIFVLFLIMVLIASLK